MSITSIPPCVPLYADDRRAFLTGIIASLEEELRQIPAHRFNVQERAGRERALAGYRESLSRLDASVSSERPR